MADLRGGNLVYVGFLLMGMGTLLPWNFFITADSYWQYKFRRNASDDDHWEQDPRTPLQLLFGPLQVCFSQLPNFAFLALNALYCGRFPQRLRLLGSLGCMILLFTVTTVFTKVDTDSWQIDFMAMTISIIFVLNICQAILQGGILGLAGMFPTKYMTAVLTGQALSGVFSSAARVVSLAVGGDQIQAAFIYFIIAVFVMLFTGVVYLAMSHMDFYKHYTGYEALDSSSEHPQSNLQVFKQILPLCAAVCVIFTVTLSVFPVVCVRIVSTSVHKEWAEIFFQPVITFLLYNVGDLFGRQLAGWMTWPRRGSLLYILVALRVGFIPLFLFCNTDIASVPSYFTRDSVYITLMVLFSVSNGHLTALCFMSAPKMVAPEDAEKAGMMLAGSLGLGLLLGAVCSFG
ncbi:unnamed protein product, partial [Meganyctiphanes norvegica]